LRPRFLLLAPPCVWATAGLLLLLDPRHALDYFPFLWIANDVGVLLAVGGLFMVLLGSGEREPSPVNEWTGFRGAKQGEPALEELLADLAHPAKREAPR
jgi:hypothetical protein